VLPVHLRGLWGWGEPRSGLVQVALEPDEEVADLSRLTKFEGRIRDRLELEAQQGREFVRVQLAHTLLGVLGQDEVEEALLTVGVAPAYLSPGIVNPRAPDDDRGRASKCFAWMRTGITR